MPTLADIYSAINTAKRKGSDFVQNPGTSLQQMLGNANDQARGFNQLNDQALAEMEQTGKLTGPAGQQLMQQMGQAFQPAGMTVYHGSPHIFEKFDLSKMGTGEGAQAYGKGMYMAQNPQVAQDYKNTLSKDVFNVGGEIYDPSSLKHLNVKVLAKRGNLDEAIEKAREISLSDSPSAKLAQQDLMALENVKAQGGLQKHEGGFYKVDLPDTHIRRMIDWDEPIKNQPVHVRNLAKTLGVDLNDMGGDLIGQIGKGEVGKIVLQKAGIPGIKYLDQTSRNAAGWHMTPPSNTVSGKWMVKGSDYNSKGNHFETEQEAKDFMKQKLSEATRNFVVFDPNHLSILERNSKPLK
jgi:hypothetical protein